MLVRKVYGDRNRRHKSRNWKLQQLNKEIEEDMNIESYDKLVTAGLEMLVGPFQISYKLSFSWTIYYTVLLRNRIILWVGEHPISHKCSMKYCVMNSLGMSLTAYTTSLPLKTTTQFLNR